MSRCCFLHVGAPKTGSTSIQDALFHELRDRRFLYACGGWPNGSFAVNSVFDPPPENAWTFHAIGHEGRFEDWRDRFARQFDRELAQARLRHAHLVISAESFWTSSREGQESLRRRLADEQVDIRVIAYVRPWIPWGTSMFQEAVKGGRKVLALGHSRDRDVFQVRERLQNLFAVFGRERVTVCLFDPTRFPDGCVVRDFCGRIGLPVSPARSWNINERLSFEALKLLFAFNRFSGPIGEWGPPRPQGMPRLVERLQQLAGPGLELHSSFLRPWVAERETENEWIEREVGVSLSSEAAERDSESAVATEADLFRYSEATRDWLARQVNARVVRLSEGPEAARAVAEQVDQLRRRAPSPRERLNDLRRLFRDWRTRITAPPLSTGSNRSAGRGSRRHTPGWR